MQTTDMQTDMAMDRLLRALDQGNLLEAQDMRELYIRLRELQMERLYWKDIAEDRKHLLTMILERK